jgi:hypothetical protein
MLSPLWTALLTLFTVSVGSVVVNEIADKGSSGQCSGADWVELYNSGGTDVALAGHVLHDDKGRSDSGAFTFGDGVLISAGGYLVLCCNSDAADQPSFKIGGDDTITLLDANGIQLSTSGELPGSGAEGKTYAANDAGAWSRTTTATPGAANVFTADTADPMAALIAQNNLGEAFFGMDRQGLPVAGFGEVVDIKMTMLQPELDYMMANQSYEVYSQWETLQVVSTSHGTVLTELTAGGRIRPRGQSTLALPTCMGIEAIPFKVDFASNDQSQTLFGMEEMYLRHHMSDSSYMREWSMHRMLARFGLPHLRTRTARFFINGQYKGLYSVMEPPDQTYVLARGFPDINLANHSLYKVKTTSLICGTWSASQLQAAKASDASTKYSFDRGTHRAKIPVLRSGAEPMTPQLLQRCFTKFAGMMEEENSDAMSAYSRYNNDCGEMMLSEGLIDRDLGQKTWDPVMATFVNKHLANTGCTDSQCSNSDLKMDVDVVSRLQVQ